MTGFGRGEATNGVFTVAVELSSVNRKQAEVAISMPRDYAESEQAIRKHILSKISRGRINTQISISLNNAEHNAPIIDQEKVKFYQKQFADLSKNTELDLKMQASDILRLPDIYITQKIPLDGIHEVIMNALDSALSPFLQMRMREGADLEKDTHERLTILEKLLLEINERSPLVLEAYRNKLIQKLKELNLFENPTNLAEDERIIKEVALFADKTDISEEITRFRSHLDKFYEYMAKSEPVGRSLDFLCQELNRELNTIGSKANNAELAHYIVTGKTEVEKIREQIQNVE